MPTKLTIGVPVVYSRKAPFTDLSQGDVLLQIMDKTINLRPPIPQSCPIDIGVLMKGCFQSDPKRRPSAYDAYACIHDSNFVVEGRTDSLLTQMFPTKVAEALRDGRKIEPKLHECVTVFFSDIVRSTFMRQRHFDPIGLILKDYLVFKTQVGFTRIASAYSPTKVSDLLDRLYTKFDRLCTLHDVFKVETVGYVAIFSFSCQKLTFS